MAGKKRPWWKPRRSRHMQWLALAVVVLSIVGGLIYVRGTYTRLMEYPQRPGSGSSDPIELEVPRGASFPQVLTLLVEHGVIPEDEATYFKVYVLNEGAARKTTAGPHVFRADMTPAEVLEEMQRRQKVAELRVTLPEGKNILEVAAILAEAGLSDAPSLEAAMRDAELLEKLGIEGETAEGYLFPDTYKFKTKASAAEIVTRLVKRHRQVYADLSRRHRDALDKLDKGLKWGDREVVTLASIVEKETGAKHERPLIAGVFLNRMRFSSFQPKRLETDPTIIYGCTVPEQKSAACKKFEGRIRTIHLRDKDNLYSTYTHEGLPPGPISNPGQAALEAVMAPKKSRFLFFVSRNDGTHQFSKSVSEHEYWVNVHQVQGKVGPQKKPKPKSKP